MTPLDDKDEFFSQPMTNEESVEYFQRMLEEHKGNDRIFVHCNKEWRVDRLIMPVIMCPECKHAMAAVSII